jgi:hypothetical protein
MVSPCPTPETSTRVPLLHQIESWLGQNDGKDWIADWTVPRICRPYDANEVFVTGTFDDWGKTVKLDRVDDGFAKEVSLPIEKVHYKAGFPFHLRLLHL